MENQQPTGSHECLPYKSAPFFAKEPVLSDSRDKAFACLYFFLGYGFIYSLSGSNLGIKLAIFTVIYIITVSAYLSVKGRRPTKESYFWMAVMLAVGLPYAFWSVMPALQPTALIFAAAYWTISAGGRLLDHSRTSEWILFDGLNAMIMIPFHNFTCHVNILSTRILHSEETEHPETEHPETKHRRNGLPAMALGFLIAVPILIVVLPILSSADAGFEYLLQNSGAFIQEHFLLTLVRILLSLPVTAYLFGLAFGSISGRNTDRISKADLQTTGRSIRVVPDTAIYTALSTVCLVYLLFIGLQAKYLFSAFSGSMPAGFTFAEYARRGFFELCAISLLNILLLLGAGIFTRTQAPKNKGLKLLSVLLSVLTLLIITTAVSKMVMYILAYGLTVKRVLTMVFMLWMAIVFICVVIRQKKEFPLVRLCAGAGAILFSLLCIIPVENCIAAYNLLL